MAKRWWMRTAGAALATAAFAVAAGVVSPPANAHRDPTIAVRLSGVEPKLPAGVRVDVIDTEQTYLGVANHGTTPVYVLDPEGRSFLSISADGVFAEADSRYLSAARSLVDDAESAPKGCCPGDGWVRLSSEPRWAWADPRLDPPLRDLSGEDDRGLDAMTSAEPLATWTVPIEQKGAMFDVTGVVERRQVGTVTTTVEAAPEPITIEVTESRPPQLRMEFAAGTRVAILGHDGRPVMRVTPEGASARASSPEYRAHRRAVGLSPRPWDGWVPLEAATWTSVVWADPRLDHQRGIPAAETKDVVLNEWRIPVVVDGQAGEITGRSTWSPTKPPVPDRPAKTGLQWGAGSTAAYVLAGGLTALLVTFMALAWWRVRSATRCDKETEGGCSPYVS